MEIWKWVFIAILFLADLVVKIEPFKLGHSQHTERISGSAGDVLEDDPVGRFLLSSPVRTLNPEDADWFYTTVYTTCDLTPNGLPLPFKSPRMMRSAIQLISSKWP
ncbi:hypothetical protein DITRI_Ditri07aG0047900 [Diplodiscus trichospermus]